MSTLPEDIELFDVRRIWPELGSLATPVITEAPCITYWLIPEEGVCVSILFDSKRTLKLALLAARCMAAGGTLNFNGESFNSAYFREHFFGFLDFRGAELAPVKSMISEG